MRFASSAAKHGVEREDILFAMTRALLTVAEFDEPRAPGLARPTLYIGLSRAGRLIEVLVAVTPPNDLFIFHAMLLRPEIATRAGFFEEYPDLTDEEA